MMRFHFIFLEKIWQRFPTLKQFIKYSFVGVLNTITDFFIYFLLTRLIYWFNENYLVANAISFTCAVTQSFFINKNWTFQYKSDNNFHFHYLKFFLANAFTLLVNQFILYSLVDWLNIFDLYAKVLLIISSVILNFTIVKFWVFKK